MNVLTREIELTNIDAFFCIIIIIIISSYSILFHSFFIIIIIIIISEFLVVGRIHCHIFIISYIKKTNLFCHWSTIVVHHIFRRKCCKLWKFVVVIHSTVLVVTMKGWFKICRKGIVLACFF